MQTDASPPEQASGGILPGAAPKSAFSVVGASTMSAPARYTAGAERSKDASASAASQAQIAPWARAAREDTRGCAIPQP